MTRTRIPLYSQYRKAYIREGDRAAEDALGAAAAASGGLPSSYAQTAASQAGNYYAAQLTDKIPELQQLAYQKYLNDYNMLLSDLGVVQGQEATRLQQVPHGPQPVQHRPRLRLRRVARPLQHAREQPAGRAQPGRTGARAAISRSCSSTTPTATFTTGSCSTKLTTRPTTSARSLTWPSSRASYGDYRGLEDLGIQLPTPSGYAGAGAGSSAGYDDEAGNPPGATDERISSEAMNILNAYMHVNPGTNGNVGQVFANRINSALSAGRISQEEADYLREMIGIAA